MDSSYFFPVYIRFSFGSWPNRTVEKVKIGGKEYPVYYIGLDDLIQNKRKVNRYKDLEDLKYLISLKKEK